MAFFREHLGRRFQDFPESFENIHLVPILPKELSKGAPYVVSDISRNDYSWLSSAESVPTMAVKSLLVSRDFSSKKNQYYRRRCE